MRQTTLSVVLEVQPESLSRLETLICDLRQAEEAPTAPYNEPYERLKHKIHALHFMSINVFPAAEYDPVLVIEVNFDGEPGPFWAQLEATLGDTLRPMLRCCKRPADEAGALYDSVVRPNSRHPIAPYLEARTVKPSVFHHGNRGLGRDRILNEAELFAATRDELAQRDSGPTNPYRGLDAQQIHARLRGALRPHFRWLDGPPPPRIAPAERAADIGRLVLFVFGVLAALSMPGIVVALVAPPRSFLVLGFAALVLVYVQLYRMRTPQKGKGAVAHRGGLTVASLSSQNPPSSLANPVTLQLAVIAALLSYFFAASLVAALVLVPVKGEAFRDLFWPTARVMGLGLLSGLFVTLPGIVLWLRYLERHDATHDEPSIDPALLCGMAHLEDRIAQNHMGSIVLVKPGVLRMALFRAGHFGLGLVLRVLATDGYLGSMRTVHFAHWAFISNGGRLLFFSNFDHSWESYLDDFIEKAHGGLTLAWGSGTGFPPTRFLVLDGASHGRKFKAWARHSMAISRFWYSAYKHLTVDQIERQARVADGLRKTSLTAEEAAVWARDL